MWRLECTGGVVLLSTAVALWTGQYAAGWTIEPVDTSGAVGWSMFIDVDPAGHPHAAYYTTNPSGDFRYSRREPGGWQQKAVIDNAAAFAMDQHGDRYFVSEPGPNFYPHFQLLLDNGMVLGQQLAATRISQEVFLDFDQQNRPHIGWVDTVAQQLKHSFWNGTSWTTRTVATSSSFSFSNAGFAATLDDSDQIHFSWRNSTSRLQYAKPVSTTWQISSPFPTSDASPYDMDVDSAGNVHLAYNVSTGNVFTGGLFYGMFDGTSWAGGRVSGLDSFGVGRTQIVTDETGEPHLFTYDAAFSGPKTLKHVYRETGAWANDIIDSYTGGSSGPENIDVVKDDQGFHVLYATGHQQIHYAFLSTASLVGDMNRNGVVDAADYVVWRKTGGTEDEFNNWQANFGAQAGGGIGSSAYPPSPTVVPEPGSSMVLLLGLAAMGWRDRRIRGGALTTESDSSGNRTFFC